MLCSWILTQVALSGKKNLRHIPGLSDLLKMPMQIQKGWVRTLTHTPPSLWQLTVRSVFLSGQCKPELVFTTGKDVNLCHKEMRMGMLAVMLGHLFSLVCNIVGEEGQRLPLWFGEASNSHPVHKTIWPLTCWGWTHMPVTPFLVPLPHLNSLLSFKRAPVIRKRGPI